MFEVLGQLSIGFYSLHVKGTLPFPDAVICKLLPFVFLTFCPFVFTCVEHQVIVKAASLSKFLAAQMAGELVPCKETIHSELIFFSFSFNVYNVYKRDNL